VAPASRFTRRTVDGGEVHCNKDRLMNPDVGVSSMLSLLVGPKHPFKKPENAVTLGSCSRAFLI
jgi:hypothetical protein